MNKNRSSAKRYCALPVIFAAVLNYSFGDEMIRHPDSRECGSRRAGGGRESSKLVGTVTREMQHAKESVLICRRRLAPFCRRGLGSNTDRQSQSAQRSRPQV